MYFVPQLNEQLDKKESEYSRNGNKIKITFLIRKPFTLVFIS